MNFIKQLLKRLLAFLSRRIILVGRIIIGIFMILMGAWFAFAPMTQQFFDKSEALQDAPYIWLIVPLGILQIAIGIGLLRPVVAKNKSDK